MEITENYLEGFCKTAEAYGLDPEQLVKVALTPAQVAERAHQLFRAGNKARRLIPGRKTSPTVLERVLKPTPRSAIIRLPPRITQKSLKKAPITPIMKARPSIIVSRTRGAGATSIDEALERELARMERQQQSIISGRPATAPTPPSTSPATAPASSPMTASQQASNAANSAGVGSEAARTAGTTTATEHAKALAGYGWDWIKKHPFLSSGIAAGVAGYRFGKNSGPSVTYNLGSKGGISIPLSISPDYLAGMRPSHITYNTSYVPSWLRA